MSINSDVCALAVLTTAKKLHLFCADPGAYQMMSAMMHQLRLYDVPCQLYCDGWAAENSKVPFEQLTVQALLDVSEHELFVLGSQVNYSSTYQWLRFTKKNAIPVAFIFDHWKNYLEHFTNGLREDIVLPDLIFFPDSLCKQGFLSQLQTYNQINNTSYVVNSVVSGHFALDQQIATIQTLSKNDIAKTYHLANSKMILILLEPENLDFNYGYTLEDCLQAMQKELLNLREVHEVFVKPHPRQSVDSVVALLNKRWNNRGFSYRVLDASHSLDELILLADQVWGITTVALIIAKKIGKPIKSFQVGRNALGQTQSNQHIEEYVIV